MDNMKSFMGNMAGQAFEQKFAEKAGDFAEQGVQAVFDRIQGGGDGGDGGSEAGGAEDKGKGGLDLGGLLGGKDDKKEGGGFDLGGLLGGKDDKKEGGVDLGGLGNLAGSLLK